MADDERRERILEAALAEFAEKGYARGSTNAIAKAAGVAKGLLFHHFGSKRDLYVATVDRAIAKVTQQYEAERSKQSEDIFERLLRGGVQSLELMRRYPLEYRLFRDAFYSRESPLPEHVREKYEELGRTELQKLLLDKVDASRLRPGVSLEHVADLIRLIADGLTRRLEREQGSREDWADHVVGYYSRLGVYLDIVRDGAYVPDDPGGSDANGG